MRERLEGLRLNRRRPECLVMLLVGSSLSVLLVADVEVWPGMIAVIPAP